MLRMSPSLAAPVALAVALAAAPALAQQDFSKVRIVPQAVAPGIWMLTGAGGNIGLCSGDDGAFLIDDQFAPLTDRIKAVCDSVTGGKPIRFVLNTHYHGDHVGGNENFGKAGVLIIAQDNVRRRMSVDQFNAAFNRTTLASPPRALPVVTFTDSVTLHMNGDTERVFHVPPAHTDGDVMIHFVGANVLHMGDCFFNGFYPVIDVSAGGSVDGMIAAADRTLAFINADTRLIPGHGPLGDRAALQAFRDMLSTVRDRVAKLIAQGRTLDEIKAAKPVADLDATWDKTGKRADSFVEVVYRSLTRDRSK